MGRGLLSEEQGRLWPGLETPAISRALQEDRAQQLSAPDSVNVKQALLLLCARHVPRVTEL